MNYEIKLLAKSNKHESAFDSSFPIVTGNTVDDKYDEIILFECSPHNYRTLNNFYLRIELALIILDDNNDCIYFNTIFSNSYNSLNIYDLKLFGININTDKLIDNEKLLEIINSDNLIKNIFFDMMFANKLNMDLSIKLINQKELELDISNYYISNKRFNYGFLHNLIYSDVNSFSVLIDCIKENRANLAVILNFINQNFSDLCSAIRNKIFIDSLVKILDNDNIPQIHIIDFFQILIEKNFYVPKQLLNILKNNREIIKLIQIDSTNNSYTNLLSNYNNDEKLFDNMKELMNLGILDKEIIFNKFIERTNKKRLKYRNLYGKKTKNYSQEELFNIFCSLEISLNKCKELFKKFDFEFNFKDFSRNSILLKLLTNNNSVNLFKCNIASYNCNDFKKDRLLIKFILDMYLTNIKSFYTLLDSCYRFEFTDKKLRENFTILLFEIANEKLNKGQIKKLLEKLINECSLISVYGNNFRELNIKNIEKIILKTKLSKFENVLTEMYI